MSISPTEHITSVVDNTFGRKVSMGVVYLDL